jgi:hypothetical protein
VASSFTVFDPTYPTSGTALRRISRCTLNCQRAM